MSLTLKGFAAIQIMRSNQLLSLEVRDLDPPFIVVGVKQIAKIESNALV